MGSRIKQDPSKLFDCFLEVAKGQGEPWVLQSFPANYKDKDPERMKSVCNFVYPCPLLEITAVETFSFVLTDLEAQWTFGFCRQAANAETALVFLSSLPWHDTFYRLLNRVAEMLAGGRSGGGGSGGEDDALKLVEACYALPRPPDPGTVFFVSWGEGDFTCPVPDVAGLPTIPENRNLTEYFNAVGLETMLEVFAAMLQERRIIVTSRRLSKVSACVQAANSLIYPMFWQHIFIPILPKHLMMYLSAPMPFLIGVPALIMKHVRLDEIGEVVILDADANKFSSPFDDLQSLPPEVVAAFRRSMKNHRDLLGDAVARVFLQAVVHLIGGYREALRMKDGHKITFDEEAFLRSRSPALRPFLQNMQQLQIFRQFIDDRLNLLNDGKGFSDEFEKEAVWFAERAAAGTGASRKIKSQAAALGKEVRKEGGALVKAVKSKANPAIKSAIKTGRAGSKSAYKGVKSFVREAATAGSNYNLKAAAAAVSGTKADLVPGRNRSFNSVPTLDARSVPTSPNLSFRSEKSERNGTGRPGSSTGSSAGLSDDGSHPRSVWTAPKVLKYERFDPPPVVSATRTQESPEFENPPLDLDLMGDMKEVLCRKASPVKSAVYLVPESDLISFGTENEHEVVFDPLDEPIVQDGPTPMPAPNPDLPRPPGLHRPLIRAVTRPPHPPPKVPSRSSENLLQEYGLDFNKMSIVTHAPIPLATSGADPFADLDPLVHSSAPPANVRSVSVGQAPQPPPRIKKMSMQPAPPPPPPPPANISGWTTFE